MSRPAFAYFAQQYFAAILQNFGRVYLNEPIPRDPKLRIFKHPSRTNSGTTILSALTKDCDRVMISPEVEGEADLVDVLFEPTVEQSRQSLGLLGELLYAPSIITTLRWAPDNQTYQTCLRHWLTWTSEASGGIVSVDNTPSEQHQEGDHAVDSEPEDKLLTIILPSIESDRLKSFGFTSSKQYPFGVYHSAPAFCTTVVVVNQLPEKASTLWLRVLGRGPTQRAAMDELLRSERNHPLRSVAIEQLQNWYQRLLIGQMGRESTRLMESLSKIC